MTKPKNSPMPRRRSGRAAVLAGATVVLALCAAPGAHADSDTGPLDDITQVVGQATQPVVPVVQPVVQSVQGAVPQPVQEAVEPVVEQVVEPVRPVAEVVEQVAQPSEEPAGKPAGGRAEQSTDDPAEVPDATPAQGTVGHVASESAGAAGADMAEPAESATAQQAPGGPSGGHAGDGSGHVDQLGPAAISCPDLPPRAVPTVVALHNGAYEAPSDQWALWDVTNALMHLWAAGDWGSAGEVVSPGQGDSDRRASDMPRQVPPAVPALDIPSPGPALGPVGLVGLLGLLGVLASGVAVILARERG